MECTFGTMTAIALPVRYHFAALGRTLARAGAAMALLPLLCACAGLNQSADLTGGRAGHNTWDSAAISRWDRMEFPNKEPTRYTLDIQAPPDAQGLRNAVRAQAHGAASMLHTALNIAPENLGTVHFSWLVPALMEGADLATRQGDDSPVRLVLAFEGDRGLFSAKDAALNELTRLLTGKEMPYATLMYVWSNTRPVESIVHNARTARIRKIVVESGTQGLQQWRHYERDLRADFVAAFGEAPGKLVGIGIMTDSDNTQSQTQAWYGPIRLQ